MPATSVGYGVLTSVNPGPITTPRVEKTRSKLRSTYPKAIRTANKTGYIVEGKGRSYMTFQTFDDKRITGITASAPWVSMTSRSRVAISASAASHDKRITGITLVDGKHHG